MYSAGTHTLDILILPYAYLKLSKPVLLLPPGVYLSFKRSHPLKSCSRPGNMTGRLPNLPTFPISSHDQDLTQSTLQVLDTPI